MDRGDEIEPAPAPEPELEPEEEQEEEPEEEEQEAEGEPEEDEEPEEEEEPKPRPRQDIRIPKQRFDEVNERRKAAERRIAELEAKTRASDPTQFSKEDLEKLERAYIKAVAVDGDEDKALQIRDQIRRAEAAAYMAMATEQANYARETTKAELEFNQVVSSIEQEYPVFNPNDPDNFNEDLTDEVLDLHASFVQRGYSPAAAMQRAVRYVVRANGLDAPVAESEPAEAPREKAPAKKPNVKKKLEAAKKQPRKIEGNVDRETSSIDLDSISEEEFDALPASTRARLRGDFA
jgi:hypothetical protein